MPWRTTLYTGISFDRVTYDTKYKVEEALSEVNDSIKKYESDLKNLIFITEPKKFCEEEESPLYWLSNEADNILTELKRLYIERFKLNLLFDNFDLAYDKHKKQFKPLPNGFDCDDAYIDGDYINNGNKIL